MEFERGTPRTNDARASVGCLDGSSFGTILEPGTASCSRKRPRSCRGALAHRSGVHAFGLDHTNGSGTVRTRRLSSLDLMTVLVGQSLDPLTMAVVLQLRLHYDGLCEHPEMPSLVCDRGMASSFGGPCASRRAGTSVLTPAPRLVGTPRCGTNSVANRTRSQCPTTFHKERPC